jgi:hypothetical protein
MDRRHPPIRWRPRLWRGISGSFNLLEKQGFKIQIDTNGVKAELIKTATGDNRQPYWLRFFDPSGFRFSWS